MKSPDIFKKLKRRFVLTNVTISTIVLVIAFSAIYFVLSERSHHAPMPPRDTNFENHINDFERPAINTDFENRIKKDRKASLETLLISLIVTGIVFEIIIIFVSFYLAERSIKPVRESYESQKQFIANASHEIKTPLAVIQANLEAADIKGNHWIDNIAIKTEELAVLNNQLLALARADSIGTQNLLESVEINELVTKLTDYYAPQLTERKIKLSVNQDSDNPTYNLNQSAFAQIFNILFDNAIKYTKSKITISLSSHMLTITNNGTTIKPEDLPHIFERFYQTDKTKPGVGLGLAIAKSLADRNHWNLSASSGKSTTTFTFKF